MIGLVTMLIQDWWPVHRPRVWKEACCGFTCGPWIGVTCFALVIKTSASSYASLRRHGFSLSSGSSWDFHLTCAVIFLPNANKIVSSFLLSSFPIYFINKIKNPEKREPQFPSTRPEKDRFLREGVRRAIEPRHGEGRRAIEPRCCGGGRGAKRTARKGK